MVKCKHSEISECIRISEEMKPREYQARECRYTVVKLRTSPSLEMHIGPTVTAIILHDVIQEHEQGPLDLSGVFQAT